MNPPGSDRLLKRLWLVIGFIALPLFLLALFLMAGEAFREWGWSSDDSPVVAAPTGEAAVGTPPRAVRLSLPDRVRGTDAQLVLVRHGAAYEEPARVTGAAAARIGAYGLYDSSEPIVNVIVLSGAGDGRLIFDRPVYIQEVMYPGVGYRADSLQNWIAYEVVIDDTNGDERLGGGDALTLFVSDLRGENLRRVLPDGWHLHSNVTLADHRTILITALRRPTDAGREWKADEAPQRTFLYDVARNDLRPFATLDSLATRAGVILAEPGRRR